MLWPVSRFNKIGVMGNLHCIIIMSALVSKASRVNFGLTKNSLTLTYEMVYPTFLQFTWI